MQHSRVGKRTFLCAFGLNMEKSGTAPAGGALALASVPIAQGQSSGVCVANSSVICVVRASCKHSKLRTRHDTTLYNQHREDLRHSSS